MSHGTIRTRRSRGPFTCWTVEAALFSFGLMAALAASWGAGQVKEHLVIIKQIHAEVKEMGPYPGEAFIRREFFVGEGDDDTNKDIHVIVLIQSLESKEMMTVRVTEMAKDPGNPQARLAKSSKLLVCRMAGERLEVESSDYEEKDLAELGPEILKAVQNKKRLLKLNLCGSGRPG